MSENNTYQIRVSRDDFSKFLMLLGIFENTCTDCDIKKGKFRCRSNDRQAVISMDLTSIITDKDISFSLIKNKIQLLRSFELDDNIQVEDKTVMLESNESNYEICDPFSKLIFRKPVQRYIDNQFIVDDEFNGLIQISEDNLLFSHTVNNYMKKRISNQTLAFQTDIIECNIVESKASFKILPTSKEEVGEIIRDVQLNRDVGSKSFRMMSLPFTLDIAADLKLSCYSTNSDDVYNLKFEQTIYGVLISIYSKVKVNSI